MMDTIKKKILVVDDEPSICDLIHDILEDKYDISILNDPRRLSEQVGVYYPDLILMDVLMPGMDGDIALAKLRDEGVRVPIILYSATYSDNNIDKMRHWVHILGGQDVLTKPFEFEDLLSTIAKYTN